MIHPLCMQDIQFAVFRECHPLDLIDLKRSCRSFYNLISQNEVLLEMASRIDLYRREMTDMQVQKNLLLLFNHIEEEFIVENDFALTCPPRQRAPVRKVIFSKKENKGIKNKILLETVAKTLKEVTLIHQISSVYVWEEGVKNSWQFPVDYCMNKIIKSSRYRLDATIVDFATKIIETAKEYSPVLVSYRDPSYGSDIRSAPPLLKIESSLFDKSRWHK